MGYRLRKCSTDTFARQARGEIPELRAPVLGASARRHRAPDKEIRAYNKLIEEHSSGSIQRRHTYARSQAWERLPRSSKC